MAATDAFRARTGRACREVIPVCGAFICCIALFLAAPTNAQDGPTVISIDYFRSDLVNGEPRHEILPVAVFEGGQFLSVSERSRTPADTRRRDLLSAHPSVQVLYRGRRIGTLDVSDIYQQRFHCSGLFVGSGAFEPDGPQPESETYDSVRARSDEYDTLSLIALSGALDAVRRDGDPLVVTFTDPAETERFAIDVQTVAPRSDLPPLSDDETRAYRLDRYDAVLVIRKRRSAKMVPFPPVEAGLPSPLMTDIVVVRTGPGERMVHPLWISERGTDSWGKGPQDFFIDTFELEDGTAYFAFHRRDYEANRVRLYRLPQSGAPAVVFEDDLYGC
jgi:hypothetical protein